MCRVVQKAVMSDYANATVKYVFHCEEHDETITSTECNSNNQMHCAVGKAKLHLKALLQEMANKIYE